MAADPPKPSVGRIVHYVSYSLGHDGGWNSSCRAAVITEVYWTHTYDEHGVKIEPSVPDEQQRVSLAVLTPTGMSFNQGIAYSEEPDEGESTGFSCGSTFPKGDTWHWPART